MKKPCWLLAGAVLLMVAEWVSAEEIMDSAGRLHQVPVPAERVICSGPGCLRLLVYLQAQDRVVAVDDIEGRRRQFDARPYAMANPQFKSLPVFGEFRGKDNPELILTLDPAPQVILKLVGTGKGTAGMDPGDLQDKTGIPVVALKYGNLGTMKEELYGSLRIMADVVGKQQRAAEVADDARPLDPDCACPACARHSRAYLHHLFKCEELLAYRLATIHNLRFIARLVQKATDAIKNNSYASFKQEFLSNYKTTDEITRIPCTTGQSTPVIASINWRPIPGQEKMVSVMMAPVKRPGMLNASKVISGIKALRKPCFKITMFSIRPFARAVRM